MCRWFNSALGHQISRSAKRAAKSAEVTMSPATSAKKIDPNKNMLSSMIVKVMVSEL